MASLLKKSGMELLKKGAEKLTNIKKRYNEAYERGQNTPRKKKLKRMMDGGYNP